ncbi:hypothetical protein Ndes2526B_g05164 [Nannochloris sp. 'desiccata']
MGFKRLSKGKPFASPSKKRKATDADAPDEAAEKFTSLTPAKAEEEASAKRATSHAMKRRTKNKEKTPELNDDLNNAVGALDSSGSPSSGSGGAPIAPVTAGGMIPTSVSTAAAAIILANPPVKNLPIYANTTADNIRTTENPEVVPLAAVPPPTKAALPPYRLPFPCFTGLAPNNLLPAAFPFSALQQQRTLQLPHQQQQQQQASSLPAPVVGGGVPSPLSTSASPMIAELSPVQQAVIDHANATGLDPGIVWTFARQIAVQYTAKQLLKALAAPIPDFPSSSSSPLPPAPAAKVTAGVSYVVRSESKQIEVSDQDILPHMVYRPPGPPPGAELSQASPEVAAALEILLNQTTLAVSMPLKDENAMKTYLLEHAERAALLDAAEGTIMKLEGASNVAPLCVDKSFVCLHYKLVQNEGNESGRYNGDSFIKKLRHGMKLVPCLPSSTSSEAMLTDTTTSTATEGNSIKTSVSSSTAALALASSNVQLGIMIRKGVGGTYPLRSAARKLHARGLLGALMDKNLPTSTTATSVDNEETENGQEGIANGTQFSEPPANSPATEGPSEGPAPAHQRLSLYTLSCRLELYIDEETWETLDLHSRLVLQSTIYHLEHLLRAHFDTRNWEMLKSTVREKLETLVATTGTGSNEKDKESSPDTIENVKSKDVLDSALAVKLLPLFSLPEIATNKVVPPPTPSSSSSSPFLGKDTLMMDFSLALVLAASCLSTESHALHHMPWPLYCINTRDCFTHHLVPIETIMHAPEGRTFTRTEWFFRAGQLPADYQAVIQRCNLTKTGESTGNARKCDFAAAQFGENSTEIAGVLANMVDTIEKVENNLDPHLQKPNSTAATLSPTIPLTDISTIASGRNTASGVLFPVGVTTYNEAFSPTQLSDIELRCDLIDSAAREGRLPATCSHSTLNKGGGLKRTKFFFGARYLWTREQLAAPDAHVAKGVRVDVPPAPKWVHAVVESPLVAATVLPEGHINSVALNMYHDGSEGIQVHYDDSARFQQPIFSLRLFSDSRLSFGTQLYGYTNGSFFIPMPRGCVAVMEAGSYAANGVKHCVRPVDMAGKSAGMILRRMNPTALADAREHFMEESIDWMRGLSLNASLRAESLLGQGLAELAFGHRNNNSHYHHRLTGSGARGLPGSKTMRQIANIVEYMVRSVEYTDWKEGTREATVASVVTRMVRRVEVAEKSGLNLVENDDKSVFGVVDSMVSCFEILSASPSETGDTAFFWNRKFWPPRPYINNGNNNVSAGCGGGKGSRGPYRKRPREVGHTQYNGHTAGSNSVLPDAAVIALTINKMMSAIEATEQKNEIAAVAHVMGRMVSCINIEAQNA